MPARDARGRFVAFPTMVAPSWYVLCADGYRIPGEDEAMAMATGGRPETQPLPLPPAHVVQRRWAAMRWDEVATWLIIAILVVVVGWYGIHLQVPHR